MKIIISKRKRKKMNENMLTLGHGGLRVPPSGVQVNSQPFVHLVGTSSTGHLTPPCASTSKKNKIYSM